MNAIHQDIATVIDAAHTATAPTAAPIPAAPTAALAELASCQLTLVGGGVLGTSYY